MSVEMFGPVPPGPPSLVGAMVLVGVGLVGFLSIIFSLLSRKGRAFNTRKMVFFAVILVFFIVIGLVELLHLK